MPPRRTWIMPCKLHMRHSRLGAIALPWNALRFCAKWGSSAVSVQRKLAATSHWIRVNHYTRLWARYAVAQTMRTGTPRSVDASVAASFRHVTPECDKWSSVSPLAYVPPVLPGISPIIRQYEKSAQQLVLVVPSSSRDPRMPQALLWPSPACFMRQAFRAGYLMWSGAYQLRSRTSSSVHPSSGKFLLQAPCLWASSWPRWLVHT